MPLRRSKNLVKWVIENQHKFQSIRACSSSLRYKEQLEEPGHAETVAPSSVIHAVPTQPLVTPRKELTPDVSFKYEDLQVKLAAPYQLQPKPDVDQLGFGKYFTDHMFRVKYERNLGGWQKPEIVPLENLTLHPAVKALHYAIQLFEGMKAYRGVDDRIRLFRPELNMARMNNTALRSGLPTFDGEEFVQCISRLVQLDQEWVPHSESASMYIRPTLIATDAAFGITAPESALLFVILSPVNIYFKNVGVHADGAVGMYADPNVVRSFPGGVGNKKVGSNYGPTIEVTTRAVKLGYQQVLWLFGPDHQLTEIGAMNIFVVYVNEHGDKQLSTPPLNGLILPGITRRSIIELASQWEDVTVREEIITMKDIVQLNNEGRLLEVFGAGTAASVSPINRIGYLGNDINIPTMKQSEPLFKRLKDTLLAIQYGHVEHPYTRIIK